MGFSSNRCNKWRILFFKNEEDLPDKWFCEMNNDPLNNECTTKERCGDWYEKNRKVIEEMIEINHGGKNAITLEVLDSENSDRPETTKDLVQKDNIHGKAEATKKDLLQKDSILVAMGLLDFFDKSKQESAKGTPISVISDIQFQEMLQTESADLAIEASHAEAELALASEAPLVAEVSSVSHNQAVQSVEEPQASAAVLTRELRATHQLTDSITTDTDEERVQSEGTRMTPMGVSDLGCEVLPIVMSTVIAEDQQPCQRSTQNDGTYDDAPMTLCLPEPGNPRCQQANGPPQLTSTGKSSQEAIEVVDDSDDELDMSLFYEIARTLF
jgi:CW-type Zinc Finger